MVTLNLGSERNSHLYELTSLSVDEFDQLVECFNQAFIKHMQHWTMEGKRRRNRSYTTYANSPLPTPEDRLFFLLCYIHQAPVQRNHARQFNMSQPNANKWIHALMPALKQALLQVGENAGPNISTLRARFVHPQEREVGISYISVVKQGTQRRSGR